MHAGEPATPEVVVNEPEDSATPSLHTDSGGGCCKVLYLLSGPPRPNDGLGKFLRDGGVDCAEVDLDLEVNELHDLLGQDVWERIQRTLPMYGGYGMSPPCSTFSAARGGPTGPQPLCSASGAEVYGLKSEASETGEQEESQGRHSSGAQGT